MATSEFSHEAVKKHQETIINSLKTERLEIFLFQFKKICHKILLHILRKLIIYYTFISTGNIYHSAINIYLKCYESSKEILYFDLKKTHTHISRDVSVRQRAVDLLYAMCDRSNASEIVAEMLTYLETADYSIREEMVGNFLVIWKLHDIQDLKACEIVCMIRVGY